MKQMRLRLDFDTCNDDKCDKYIKEYLERICQEILDSLGSRTVKTIILTGGMTRKEGSALSYGKEIDVFSDCDFLVLVDKITREISRKFKYISTKLTEEFSTEGLPSHIDMALVTPKGLSHMKARMFTLELRQYGKSIYGEDHRKYMPDLKAEDIPPEDSLRMLHNRIAGTFEYFDPDVFLWNRRKDEQLVKSLIYHTGMSLVSIASSLLSLEKMYVASYREKVDILKANFQKFDISREYPIIPKLVEKWIEFKFNPDIRQLLEERGYGTSYKDMVELAKELWLEHVGYLEGVWKYTVQKMYNTEETDTIKLIDIYFSNNNTIRQRLEGCYHYLAKKPLTFSLLTLLDGCLKSIRGSALFPSIYSLSDLLFFDSPVILGQDMFPHKSSFVKYIEKLPIHLSLKGNSAHIWDNMRRDVINLWYQFLK